MHLLVSSSLLLDSLQIEVVHVYQKLFYFLGKTFLGDTSSGMPWLPFFPTKKHKVIFELLHRYGWIISKLKYHYVQKAVLYSIPMWKEQENSRIFYCLVLVFCVCMAMKRRCGLGHIGWSPVIDRMMLDRVLTARLLQGWFFLSCCWSNQLFIQLDSVLLMKNSVNP